MIDPKNMDKYWMNHTINHLRSTRKKKEENIWRKKMFFTEGTINGEGKGG